MKQGVLKRSGENQLRNKIVDFINLNSFKLLFFGVVFLLSSLEIHACHALAIQNFSVNQTANGIEVNGFSAAPTCGCTNTYWMDIEVRCVGEPFDGAPFNPGFYGPLNDYPYFQSPILNKPGCVLTPYPTTSIPYGAMCPGVDYEVRVRENHNGDVGSWSTPISFTVPGVQVPLTGTITASPPAVCVGDPVELEFNTTGGCSNGLDFEWESSPDVGGSPSGTWTYVGNTNPITVFPTQDTWYQVTIDGSCGNDFLQLMILVTVLPPPSPGVASIDDLVVCEGGFTNVSVNGQGGLIQWQTSVNGGPWTDISNAINGTESVGPINNTTCFRVEVVGCGATVYSNEVCVDITPNPNIQINFPTICEGESVDLVSNVDLIGGVYMWDNNPTLNTPNLTGLNPSQTTTYTLEYSLNGCTTTQTTTITVNPNPVLSVGFNNVCLGVPTIFNDSSIFVDSWLWDFGDGNTSTDQNPSYTFSTSGIQNVTLIGTSTEGCESVLELSVEVFPNPLSNFDFVGSCVGDEIQFNGLSNNNIVEWLWDFGDGNTSIDQNPSHTYINPNTYNVYLSVIDGNGCSNDTTQLVDIYDTPNVNINGFNLEGCSPHCFNLISETSSSDSIVSWNWILSNGVSYSSQNVNDCITNNTSNDISYGVWLEATTEWGCTNSILVDNFITVYKQAKADFSFNPPNPTAFSPEIDFTNLSTNSDFVLWVTPYGTTSDLNPTVYFDGSVIENNITLIAYTNNGCNDTINTLIIYNEIPIFYIPNTFTPDGDKHNQKFQPIFTSGFDPMDFHLMIFNRWGEVVFESYNAEVGWDGTYGGEVVKDGTYVWKIEYKKQNETFKETITGHVNVLK